MFQNTPDWALTTLGKKIKYQKKEKISTQILKADADDLAGYLATSIGFILFALLLFFAGTKLVTQVKGRTGVEIQAEVRMTDSVLGRYHYEYDGKEYTSRTMTILPFISDTVVVDPLVPRIMTPGSVYHVYNMMVCGLSMLFGGIGIYLLILSIASLFLMYRHEKAAQG